MSLLFIFLSLIHCTMTLKCYDCENCPYPWSTYGVQTYGSIFSIFSRVRSCYKKEFYHAIDRRLDTVARGALDKECRPGKLETINERSVTYCCYTNYCNGTHPRQLPKYVMMEMITFLILVMFVMN